MEQRSSKFLDCARLLRRLDEILAEGNGDGPEAGAVWNQMEEPWYALTEGEQQLLDLLSADVRTLQKVPRPRPAPNAVDRVVFDAVLQAEDWREVWRRSTACRAWRILSGLLFCELMRGTRSSRLPAALTRTACVTEEIMQGRFRQLLGL